MKMSVYMISREDAKEIFKSDKDAYGKTRSIMKKIDMIYDSFENKFNASQNVGCIYYHGTSGDNVKSILENGFNIGTYFTWDLHSSLMMGGKHIFAIYFDKLSVQDYWEYITPIQIPKEKILFYREFSVIKHYDNEEQRKYIRKHIMIENYGNDVVQCIRCDGHGQISQTHDYTWEKCVPLVVCTICSGYGCIRKDGRKLNE